MEAVNKLIVKGLKKRLDEAKGRWPEELNDVLSAHMTAYKTAMGESPYNLVYGVDDVILAEVGLISHRVANFDTEQNDQRMRMQLDLIEELREKSHLRNLEYKRRSATFYNKRVNSRSF